MERGSTMKMRRMTQRARCCQVDDEMMSQVRALK